ncbi:hypothetical protein H9W91_07145 [Streptomyces alfalfae]|uniref:hypothetical protein n=1 Tax=Streptomyces alfalfae TaxID=1642299 RepID=UPI001BAAFD01|nr:hypothetical protein [Streptomyces alfalfae]QUI30664.1 hypothetical protein H9W91_07145 [Streptomyces alfalfae]
MNKFIASIIHDNGGKIPAEFGLIFEHDYLTLSEISQKLYEQAAQFGLYDDTIPGQTTFIPAARIYSITVEESE